MARYFNNTIANYLLTNATPVADYPITLAAWYNLDTLSAEALLSVGDWDSQSQVVLQVNTTVNAISYIDTGQSSAAASSAAATAATWQHGCAVFASSTSRAAYLNGGSKGTNTVSRVLTGLSNIAVGRYATTATSGRANGSIAHAAVWSAALDDSEVAALGAGFSPLMIRPQSLVAYWPLLGNDSPEPDWWRGYDLLINGTVTKTRGCRIIWPSARTLNAFRSPNTTVTVLPGTIAVEGQTIAVTAAQSINVTPATIAVVGQAIGVVETQTARSGAAFSGIARAGIFSGISGAFPNSYRTVSSPPTNIIIPVDGAQITVSGQDVGVIAPQAIAVVPATIAVEGQTINVVGTNPFIATVVPATIAVEGQFIPTVGSDTAEPSLTFSGPTYNVGPTRTYKTLYGLTASITLPANANIIIDPGTYYQLASATVTNVYIRSAGGAVNLRCPHFSATPTNRLSIDATARTVTLESGAWADYGFANDAHENSGVTILAIVGRPVTFTGFAAAANNNQNQFTIGSIAGGVMVLSGTEPLVTESLVYPATATARMPTHYMGFIRVAPAMTQIKIEGIGFYDCFGRNEAGVRVVYAAADQIQTLVVKDCHFEQCSNGMLVSPLAPSGWKCWVGNCTFYRCGYTYGGVYYEKCHDVYLGNNESIAGSLYVEVGCTHTDCGGGTVTQIRVPGIYQDCLWNQSPSCRGTLLSFNNYGHQQVRNCTVHISGPNLGVVRHGGDNIGGSLCAALHSQGPGPCQITDLVIYNHKATATPIVTTHYCVSDADPPARTEIDNLTISLVGGGVNYAGGGSINVYVDGTPIS